MERQAWSFALVSVAVQLSLQDELVQSARIVLGGVSTIPWRVPAAEAVLLGRRVSEELAERAAEAALAEAVPLSHNGYKVTMARGLIRRAILDAGGYSNSPALNRGHDDRLHRPTGTTGTTDEIKQRKIEHVTTSLYNDVSAPQSASWSDVRLIHQALPEVDLDEIDTSVTFLGRSLRQPVLVSSLTGGHPDVAGINSRLAAVAEEYGLAMGVGSQRAALVNPSLAETYQVVRRQAPHAFLIANIGVPQLIAQESHAALEGEHIESAIRMIDANALAIHLNFLQEAAQPEGRPASPWLPGCLPRGRAERKRAGRRQRNRCRRQL